MTPDPSTNVQLRTHVYISPLHEFGSEGKHWSPCASALVTGETQAVLTDTGHIKSDVSALGDMIEQTGKQLTTIYVTHGHLDHYLGTGQLMQRFPGARPVACRCPWSPTSSPRWPGRRSNGRRGSETTWTRPPSSRSRWRAT